MGERPEGLELLADWERLLALLHYYGGSVDGLEFGPDEWRAHCAAGDPHWVGVEDAICEVFGPGYPLMGLRDGQLVGLLEQGGEPWLAVPDEELDAVASAGGGHWFTTDSRGVVHFFGLGPVYGSRVEQDASEQD